MVTCIEDVLGMSNGRDSGVLSVLSEASLVSFIPSTPANALSVPRLHQIRFH
jgi:hypothetical protein